MRPPLDQSLMDIAEVWSKRSTCGRNHVGAIIVKGGRHVGSGYNGAPAGMPHCEHEVRTFELNVSPLSVRPDQPGIPLGNRWPQESGCRVAIHAEANAIAYCARDGISIEGATIYTTLSPCYTCSQLIIAAGLVRVVYARQYRDLEGVRIMNNAGIKVEWIKR